jgi:superfamily I DNA and/or RNA helicase
VQVLADVASWLGASIETPDGSSWVGSPLRVHRRCEEPMFTISNRIAYRGMMVSATVSGSSPIGEVLGESAWFDQPSIAASKWSPEEGEVARELLERLLRCGLSSPDIYFITPFRIIGQRLRELLANAPEIQGRLRDNPWKWVWERVGTVHTFQGKEAEAVVLVLGASGPGEAGARRWAGKTPNLLNVAVSRAKRRLYVIGNREAWQGAGVFREMAERLPVRSHGGGTYPALEK